MLAEATLTEDTVRRVLRTTIDDLLELAWAGTHGAVASGMQSVAFTPATAIAAVFAATGQDLGMVGTSSMAHGVGRRVEDGLKSRSACPGSRSRPSAAARPSRSLARWLELIGLRGQRQGLSLRADRRRGHARAGDLARRPRWPPPAPRTSSARTTSAAAFAEDPASPRPGLLGLRRQPERHRARAAADEGADRYEATFSFDERHQGGPGIVHGGLVSAALDEACGLLATWYRFPTVTARIFVRYRRPVHINRDRRPRMADGGRTEDSRRRPASRRRRGARGGAPAFLHVPLDHFLRPPKAAPRPRPGARA